MVTGLWGGHTLGVLCKDLFQVSGREGNIGTGL